MTVTGRTCGLDFIRNAYCFWCFIQDEPFFNVTTPHDEIRYKDQPRSAYELLPVTPCRCGVKEESEK